MLLLANTILGFALYTQQRDRMLLSRRYNASSFWTAKSVPTDALAATSRERLFLNRFGTGFTHAFLADLLAPVEDCLGPKAPMAALHEAAASSRATAYERARDAVAEDGGREAHVARQRVADRRAHRLHDAGTAATAYLRDVGVVHVAGQERDRPGRGAAPAVRDLLGQCGHVDPMKRHRPPREAGEVEQIVDQRRHPLRGGADPRQVALACLVEGLRRQRSLEQVFQDSAVTHSGKVWPH